MNYPKYSNGEQIEIGDFFSAENGERINRVLFVAPNEIIFGENEIEKTSDILIPDFHQIIVWEDWMDKKCFVGWSKDCFSNNSDIFLIKRGHITDDFKTVNSFFNDISSVIQMSLSDYYNQTLIAFSEPDQ